MATSAPMGTRVFHSSLTSRRFPALRSLTADDVEVMVMPPDQPSPKKGGSGRLFDEAVVKPRLSPAGPAAAPGAGFSPGGARPPAQRPPFRPCNPVEARDTITQRKFGYVGMHSPYDLAHTLQMKERDESQKRVIAGVFRPNAPAKAREAVKVNYFLNSPDAETIAAERRFIKDKANRNMIEFMRRAHTSLAQSRVSRS